MEDHAYIGELLAAVVYLIAGARLLRLAQRTREAPERLLGVAFALIGTSYLLYTTPIIFGLESLWTPLTFAGRITFAVGVVPVALFTRTVFRRGESWATGLVCGCAVLLFVGITFSLLGGDAEGMTLSSWWFWLEWLGYTVPPAWISVEAFLAYAGAKRRKRIGLCDALVANRYLLWAFHGLFGVGGSLSVIAMYSDYAATGTFSAWTDSLLGGLEIGSIVTLWLVFFPPIFYRNWIYRLATVADVAEGNSPDGG
jgi:hypothetical protein